MPCAMMHRYVKVKKSIHASNKFSEFCPGTVPAKKKLYFFMIFLNNQTLWTSLGYIIFDEDLLIYDTW